MRSNWGDWWVISFFVIMDFSSPIFFVGFYLPWIIRTLSVNRFQSKLFYILRDISQPDVVNITWIIGHIHRSIVDKIDLTSEDVERVKNTLSITLGYIFLWNVIRRIYCQCLQLISKKYFWWTVTTYFFP